MTQNALHEERRTQFVSHKDVLMIAYGLYEKRGRVHGNDLGDWLKAEAIAGSQDLAIARSEGL